MMETLAFLAVWLLLGGVGFYLYITSTAQEEPFSSEQLTEVSQAPPVSAV